jgi:hypothetical protein
MHGATIKIIIIIFDSLGGSGKQVKVKLTLEQVTNTNH